MKFDFTAEEVSDIIAGLEKLRGGYSRQLCATLQHNATSIDELRAFGSGILTSNLRIQALQTKIGDIVDERR